MKTKRPAKTTIPSSIPAALAGAAVTFLVSLPIMWLIGNYAAFAACGLGIWIIPWLGGRIGLHFLAGNGTQGYQTIVVIFAIIAALQNAALVFWNQRDKGDSKLLSIILRVLIGLSILGILVGAIIVVAL